MASHDVLNFQVTQDELTKNWFYEFVSPYYTVASSSDTYRLSMISEYEDRLECSTKKAGIYVNFNYSDKEKRQYCLRQVLCSIASKPELGTIDFQIKHTCSEVTELRHPVFFSLHALRDACEENAGALELRFDVIFAAYRQPNINNSDEIVSRMHAFATHGEYTDATLKVGRDREYRVHRVVLASCSDVFDAIFHTDMKEKETGLIKLEDELRDEVVKAFLQYAYTRRVDDLSAVAHDLYAMAHLYNVKGLLELCETCLCVIDEKNVVRTLTMAEKYSLEYLARRAKDYIRKNISSVCKQTIYVDYLTERLSPLNAAKNLRLADHHEMKEFRERVIAYIAQNFTHVVKDDKYKELYKTHPKLILEVDEYVAAAFLAESKS